MSGEQGSGDRRVLTVPDTHGSVTNGSRPQSADSSPTASSPAGSDIVLEVSRVEVRYRHPVTGDPFCAVRDVSFKVAKGEMLAVVGPSGCGKSTLLSAIAGLVPYSTGRIAVNGVETKGPGAGRAIVFQKAALLPWRSALDNVAYPLTLRRIERGIARGRAQAALLQVGLKGFERYYPHQLSGGMQQRVNLARALVTDPELLLLDEPFAAVDAQMRELLQGGLLTLLDTTSVTGVFVTHQIDEAVLMGDRVVVLSGGPASVVRDVIDVPLGRPRDIECRRDGVFVETVATVWDIVRNEIMEGMGAWVAGAGPSGEGRAD